MFYDHDGACDLSSPLPQAFPPRDAFAATMGGTLGVKATDDVVVYARDGDARAAAEFCAVVLLEHGHVGSVSVLRGGLEAWINAGGDGEGRETSREYASVEYGGARRDGSEVFVRRPARDLLKNLSTQRLQVLDCRSVNVFAGAARDSAHVRIQGRSIHFDGFRVGHIPGAKSVPYCERGERGGREVEAIVRRGGIGFDHAGGCRRHGRCGRGAGCRGGALARRVHGERSEERYVAGARHGGLVSDVHLVVVTARVAHG